MHCLMSVEHPLLLESSVALRAVQKCLWLLLDCDLYLGCVVHSFVIVLRLKTPVVF